jgi:hypothetical protein
MLNNSAINAAVLNGTGGNTFSDEVSETYSLIDTASAFTTLTGAASDSVMMDSLLLYVTLGRVIDRMTLASTSTNIAECCPVLTEALRLLDRLLIGYDASLSDTLVLQPVLSGVINQIVTLTERIKLLSTGTPTLEVYNSIIELVALIDSFDHGILETITDAIVIDSALASLHTALENLLAAMGLLATQSESYLSIVALTSTVAMSDGVATTAEVLAALTENLVLSIPTASGQDTYLAYLLSPETASVTQYSNYNFDGCARFGDRYLFYNSTGLYEYGGLLDAGQSITATIETAAMDFGSSNLKRIPAVYLGVDTDGTLILKVRTGKTTEAIYTYTTQAKGYQTQKINVGMGLMGRYFQFELSTANSDFDLDAIEFFPVELKRKL